MAGFPSFLRLCVCIQHFICIYINHFLYPFCQQILGLFLYFGYCEYNCNACMHLLQILTSGDTTGNRITGSHGSSAFNFWWISALFPLSIIPESEGQGSQAHHRPWGRKESDMIQWLNNNSVKISWFLQQSDQHLLFCLLFALFCFSKNGCPISVM